jgi:hypothetical protein
MLPTTVKGYDTLKHCIQREKVKNTIMSILQYMALIIAMSLAVFKF